MEKHNVGAVAVVKAVDGKKQAVRYQVKQKLAEVDNIPANPVFDDPELIGLRLSVIETTREGFILRHDWARFTKDPYGDVDEELRSDFQLFGSLEELAQSLKPTDSDHLAILEQIGLAEKYTVEV